ncbi:MAG: L,D-transpeptidase [Gammaproteobacteria bacterium]|nr:L,D-transpeptidase [Gammaproteobacteria bacterium]MCZ6894296.1 L,D-transpeptidase [Gammaproteobacteria bacterium]
MATDKRLEIDLTRQQLRVLEDGRLVSSYLVSTARNGPGERLDSECTPCGRHEISEKIGQDCAVNTVFVGRKPTGNIFSNAISAEHPERDWILTRILWLSGLEPGRNSGGENDTKARYIYIHGSPDGTPLGRPGSRGCIRMRNADVVELFDQVEEGTPVDIRG